MNKINVTKPVLPPLEEFIPLLENIWENRILSNNGPMHQELEVSLCSRFDWAYASLVNNGHFALEIALKVLNVKNGGEVITTPFTFVSTVAAIVNQGYVPVFCDIKEDFTIDASQIESLVTEKTVAIVPVHVYGFPCDVEEIQRIANKHDLKVIYDAAHALGVQYKGKDIASYGNMSMFSFHATKLFHTIEGGVIICADKETKIKIDQTKNFGISDPESVAFVGMNAKMNEMQAAMGLSLLPYFDEIVAARKMIFERYAQNLNGLPEVKINLPDDDTKHNYAYMPILIIDKRDIVYDVLESENIHARKYFHPLISDFECYKEYVRSNSLRNAQCTASNVLSLPIYPSLNLREVDFICNVIRKAIA